uniref:Transmembrane protein n=1 Tax=Amphimedon queenslandica TaxID=400682 RepID=A0A1X7UUF1_AMPQE
MVSTNVPFTPFPQSSSITYTLGSLTAPRLIPSLRATAETKTLIKFSDQTRMTEYPNTKNTPKITRGRNKKSHMSSYHIPCVFIVVLVILSSVNKSSQITPNDQWLFS